MHALIEADGLSKRFGKVQALSELSLTLPPGQPVAILGPNGAGKTTFIRMVATLLRPDRGTLRVGGHDVGRDPMAVRRMIGLAGQSAAVEEMMTGRENLVMVARLYGQRPEARRSASAERILEQMDLVEDAADRQVRTYSGGHAPAARPRGQPGRGAPAAAARRADDGARPREPQRGVGRHPGDESGRDRHRADDAVSRRGRPPGGLHRHHRRGPGHRPGHARRSSSPGRAPTWSSCTPSTCRRCSARPQVLAVARRWPSRSPTRRRGAARSPRRAGRGCCPSSCGRSTTPAWRWRTSRCGDPRSTRCSWP